MREQLPDQQERLDKRVLADVAFIGLIAGFLAAIHVGLPSNIRADLAFSHEAVKPWTLLTSAYVHHDVTHLANNLAGFIVAAVIVYGLCWQLDARQWFQETTAMFLLVLPILVNLSSYAILSAIVPNASPTSQGFSGVAAGFVGFLFAAFLVWIATRTSRNIAVYLGEGLFIFMLWTLSLIYSGFESHVAGLVLVGVGFSGWGLLREVNQARIRAHWRASLAEVSVGFAIVLVLVYFLIALFPPDFASGEVATNIFAHAAGFGWGIAVALSLRQKPFRSII